MNQAHVFPSFHSYASIKLTYFLSIIRGKGNKCTLTRLPCHAPRPFSLVHISQLIAVHDLTTLLPIIPTLVHPQNYVHAWITKNTASHDLRYAIAHLPTCRAPLARVLDMPTTEAVVVALLEDRPARVVDRCRMQCAAVLPVKVHLPNPRDRHLCEV